MVLLISYDLNNTLHNYSPLFEEIKKAGTWWHHINSTWLIETDLTPQQWYERLAPHLYKTDHVIVVRVYRNYFGWLPKQAWEWLAARNF
ncbi:MAG: hypothetical protein DMD72_10760 [Gemmatimonadetes bacterium]|nr:MAG: hypothetical protein DMD72_10760 [Gemmatimonadota bacterium]